MIVDHRGRSINGGYSVTTIVATLRASKDYGARGWRTIELSASAEVAPGEDATFAHNALYKELRERISLLLGEEDRVTVLIGNRGRKGGNGRVG